jgi:hypothetical protein
LILSEGLKKKKRKVKRKETNKENCQEKLSGEVIRREYKGYYREERRNDVRKGQARGI